MGKGLKEKDLKKAKYGEWFEGEGFEEGKVWGKV